MTKNVIDTVLQKISAEKITPYPRCVFWFLNSLFWVSFGVSLLIGGLGISVILFHLEKVGISDFFDFPHGRLGIFLQSISWFWLVCFLVFVILGAWGLQHTRKGYKIPRKSLLLGNLILSFVGGIFFWGAGFSPRNIDQTLSATLPFYDSAETRRGKIWEHRRHRGLMGGKITNFAPETALITIQNRRQETFVIDISQLKRPFSVEDIRVGYFLRAIGELHPENELVFTAKKISVLSQPHRKKRESRQDR